jgi:pyridinium-3,5-biscarboxylic acid mononucleotide sulfurtransferase
METCDIRRRLEEALQGIERGIAVAVSGGIDSLTLATAAHELRGDVDMFHAVSAAVPGDATARVERLAAERGWRLRVVEAGEFEDADYVANPTNRCFFCKTNLYGTIGRHTAAQIVSGANTDDLGEYRPGLDAARNSAVRHPYLEAGIDKRGVRALARALGLGDLSELPAAPCLSSRVETGIAIRPDVLRAIHAVERDLAGTFPRGTIRCRVRAAGVVLELDPATLEALDASRRAAVEQEVEQRFAGLLPSTALSVSAYRNGSAFLPGFDKGQAH